MEALELDTRQMSRDRDRASKLLQGHALGHRRQQGQSQGWTLTDPAVPPLLGRDYPAGHARGSSDGHISDRRRSVGRRRFQAKVRLALADGEGAWETSADL